MKPYITVFAILAIALISLLSFRSPATQTQASPQSGTPDGDTEQVATKRIDTEQIDTELAAFAAHPHNYRFAEQVIDHVDGNSLIKIHSTAPLATNAAYVELRPGTIRYFRTDGTVSADGEHAEITWSIDGETHSTDIGRPGAVIMVIRSLDGVVSWYSMQYDMRC